MADAPERPAELDALVPFPPMEAQLVRELPLGEGWAYEPKWDGFRGVLENAGGELRLWSRNGRPLLRYFPELRALGELLPPRSALDGEIVIDVDGAIDFDAMQTRLHPGREPDQQALGRDPGAVRRLRRARVGGRRRCGSSRSSSAGPRSSATRRAFDLSPSSPTRDAATAWLEDLEQLGLDGVVAKRLEPPVDPGGRGAVVKVKPERTADCVVVGVRWKSKPTEDRDAPARALRRRRRDRLRRLGGRRGGAARRDRGQVLPLLDETSDRHFGEPNRWGGSGLEEQPLRPELVVEVRYDKVQGSRFRHGTKLLRFRPDKDPAQCTWAELRPPRSPAG